MLPEVFDRINEDRFKPFGRWPLVSGADFAESKITGFAVWPKRHGNICPVVSLAEKRALPSDLIKLLRRRQPALAESVDMLG